MGVVVVIAALALAAGGAFLVGFMIGADRARSGLKAEFIRRRPDSIDESTLKRWINEL